MKATKWLLILSLGIGSTAWGQEMDSMRFASVVDITEAETAPPQLFATVILACNEKVHKPIREQLVDAEGVVHIYIGALVQTNDSFHCVNIRPNEVTIGFGTTFSGRAYQIHVIE